MSLPPVPARAGADPAHRDAHAHRSEVAAPQRFMPPRPTEHVVDERLTLVAEALDGFVYQWDVVTDEVARSPGLLEVMGFRAAEVAPTGPWWRSRIPPDDLASLEAPMRALFADATRTRGRSEYRVRCRDGSWRWVADRARLVRD